MMERIATNCMKSRLKSSKLTIVAITIDNIHLDIHEVDNNRLTNSIATYLYLLLIILSKIRQI